MAGVFLMSISLLAFEITLARMLPVVLSYHYGFVVVSVSLLGLGIGSVLGSALSMAVAISLGFAQAMLLDVASYAAVSLLFATSLRGKSRARV